MSDVQISPLAKRLAEENSIDWRKIRGTGPEGRVIERDILTYLARIMSGEADLPAEPDKSEPTAPANMPAAIPANMANFAAASAGLAKEGVDLSALIGGLPPAPVAPPTTSSLEAMPPLDFGLSPPAPQPVIAPAPEPMIAPVVQPVVAPVVQPVMAVEEPVFEIDLEDGEDLVFDNPDLDTDVVVEIAAASEPDVPVVMDTPAWTMPEPVVPEVVPSVPEPVFVAPVMDAKPVMAEPAWSLPEPTLPVATTPEIPAWTPPAEPSPPMWSAPEPVAPSAEPAVPVWTAPEPIVPPVPEPIVPPVPEFISPPVPEPIIPPVPEPVIPVWTSPEPTPEPALPVWNAPEPVVPTEPVLPVWSAPEPAVVTESVWAAPEVTPSTFEPVVATPIVVPEPVVPSVPEPVAPPEPEPIAPVVAAPVMAAPVVATPVVAAPNYSAPASGVISDFFQLFAARSQFNPKSLEDIRTQLRNSLNNREIPHELFLARAAARALHLLGLEKFSLARLEANGLQAYTVNGLQHSFLEAVQGLARATPTDGEGLLVVDASHLGIDDLVLPSAAGVLALGRDGQLTLSGNLPPLQSTEFLQKVVELLEHPVGLVI